MPELPEVETVARGLELEVAGRRTPTVTIGKTDFMDDPLAIERQLPGRIICKVSATRKFLLLRLGDGEQATTVGEGSALLVHLGMTGLLLPQQASETRDQAYPCSHAAR